VLNSLLAVPTVVVRLPPYPPQTSPKYLILRAFLFA
jgi:hypothetical protein